MRLVKASGAKGLACCCAKVETCSAQGGRESMETKTADVRKMSVRHEKVQNLMYLVNEQNLMVAHKTQPKGKAMGVDKVCKEA